MVGYEPPSGWNLPPGCFEGDPNAPWNREEPKTCGDCSHLLEGCCDYGICEFEFEEAFDEEAGKRPLPAWEAACWARDWTCRRTRANDAMASRLRCGAATRNPGA